MYGMILKTLRIFAELCFWKPLDGNCTTFIIEKCTHEQIPGNISSAFQRSVLKNVDLFSDHFEWLDRFLRVLDSKKDFLELGSTSIRHSSSILMFRKENICVSKVLNIAYMPAHVCIPQDENKLGAESLRRIEKSFMLESFSCLFLKSLKL